jgi:hypothetical protein
MLEKYEKNITSQFGEDGIIEYLFTKIPISERPWSVEFGAWDGEYLSNSYNLVFNKKWNSVYIEGDKAKSIDLVKKVDSLKTSQDIEVINAFVGSEGENSLDNLLAETNIPKEFELLSIDVDGIDYHIWKNFDQYSPKVVIIEHNPTIPPHIEHIPDSESSIIGTSVRALYKLGLEKGYALVACTAVNSIFVRKEFYPLFEIDDNTPDALMKKDYLCYLIANYDGSYTVSTEPAYINIFDDNLPEKLKQEVGIVEKLYLLFKKNTYKTYREICVSKSTLK